MAASQRSKVIQLYKQLIYMGREYPKDPELFRQRVKNNFLKNKDVTDPEEIKQLLNRGEYIVKEIEALYMLRKYRTLKRRYYDTDEAADQAKFQAIEKLAQQQEPNKK